MGELLTLFWIFFKIGLFTFGGGYAMIPMFRSYLVPGYISEEMLTNFIGVSESTPGPFAVNMATFIGMERGQIILGHIFDDVFGTFAGNFLGGVVGAFVTTLAVVLPSFIIILLIAYLGSKFLESKVVHNAFKGLKPVVIGLIISVALGLIIKDVFPTVNLSTKFMTLGLANRFPFISVQFSTAPFNFASIDFIGLFIMAVIFILTRIYKKLSPILLIIISAILGLILYGLIPGSII
jgi:chromate transporter